MLDIRRIDRVAAEDMILVALMHDKVGHEICTNIMQDRILNG